MKKKKLKRIIIGILLIALFILIGLFIFDKFFNKEETKEIKVISKIDKYGYTLKENKPKEYKEMFRELEDILGEEKVDEKKYVSQISKMYIYDFYSLNDKVAKTDIGGVDFIYSKVLENYLKKAQDTYYKYVESNIYNNRKQTLPVVTNIQVGEINQKAFAYGENTDDNAYYVDVTWEYTKSAFNSYQKEATLVFIHDGAKLCLVELQ